MASENLLEDENSRNVSGGITTGGEIRMFRINPLNGALVCEAIIPSTNTSIGSTIPGGTEGSVLFIGAGSTLAQDNSNFFYDDTNNYLGIGTNTPSATLHVYGSLRLDLDPTTDSTGDIYYRDSSGNTVSLGIGTAGQVLTVASGLPTWSSAAGSTGYNLIQNSGVSVTQRTTINLSTLLTASDVGGKTALTINVTALAGDTTFIDALIANTYFTTNLANNANFISTLTSNTTFLNNIANNLTVTNITTILNQLLTTKGDILTHNATTTTRLAIGTDDYVLMVDSTAATGNAWKQVKLDSSVTGVLPFSNGGTGLSTWTQYLIPYADTTSSIGQIPIGTSGQVLTSNGAGAAPSFQDVSSGLAFQQTTQLGNLTILDSCSENDGSAIYATALSLSGGTQRYILKFTRDTNTGMYILTSSTTTAPLFGVGSPSGMALLGNFVYIFYDTGGNVLCERITKSAIGTQTAMTVPAITAPGSSYYCAWSNGTALYLVVNNGPTVYQFTVSGTTLTQTTTGTPAASLSNNAHYSSFFDGTNIYVTQEGQDISKLSNALGTATVVTTYNLSPINSEGVFGSMSAPIDSSRMYIGADGRFSDSSGNDTDTLSLFPVTKP